MAGVNISNSGLGFTRYLSDVSDTINQEATGRQLFQRTDKWTGDHVEWRVHVKRNPALGYVEDGGAFPVAGKQTYVPAKAYRKFIVGSIQLTDGVMAAGSGTENNAKDVVQSEVNGMMKGLLKLENGYLYRNGDGSVATVKTGTTGTTLLVDDGRMLWEDGVYHVYDSTLATNRGSLTISTSSSAPSASGFAQLTTAATVPSGTVSGDKLVWAGTGATSALNRAITGLDKLVDDATGTFQAVNCTTYPRYTSLVLDNSGTAQDLSPRLFRNMLAGLLQKSGNQKPASGLKVLTNSWQAINVEEMYEGEIRLTPDSKTAGLAVASFQTTLGKVDVIVDTDCLYGKMFFVDPTQIKRAVQKELHWRKEQNGGIFKASHTAGFWTATALEIADYYILERFTSGKMENLNESPASMY